jgi:flavin reductase (DIM6/NTAB) family NADH-FMN oxidoreductase RutF/rubredoxin
MIDFEALFKISYGLYIVCSGDKDKGNGFISNSVFQVTAEPAQFASCCNKENYTTEFIKKNKAFSISVLHQNPPADIIGKFGYKSGRNINKLDGTDLKTGKTGVPIVLNESIAFMECKLVQTFDVGTHLIFIGELIQAEILDDTKELLTYMHYRQIRKGIAPKNAPTFVDRSKMVKKEKSESPKSYKCSACGYIYDPATGNEEKGIKPGTSFENLPDKWTCPTCGSKKDDFIKI